MAGFRIKNYKTIITDGSNEEVVKDIVSTMDVLNEEFFGEAKCFPLDDAHPTTMVVETTTISVLYAVMRRFIEHRYPGLCVFDPDIKID